MPKKKQSEVSNATAGAAVPRIHCPACKSEISADGATLHARSEHLEDLLEADGVVEKLEKIVAGYEEKLAAAKKEKEELAAKAAAVQKTKPEVKENGAVEQGQGKQRGNWW